MKTKSNRALAAMKKSILLMIVAVVMAFFGCTENPYITSPGDNSQNTDSIPSIADPDPTPDPVGVDIPEGTITVNQAVKIAQKLAAGETSKEKYFIKGWVVGFNRSSTFETDFPKYGNDFVYLSSRQDGKGSKQFYAYRILGKFGAKLPDQECIQMGDFVVISCYPMNYNGIYESSGACFAYSSNNAHFNETFPFEFKGCPEPAEDEISVTEAEVIARKMDKSADRADRTTTESYRIRGVVTSIEDKSISSYGNLTFNITDGSTYATCYQTFYKTSNGKFTNLNQVAVGDTVLVNGVIQNFQDICEPYRAYLEESTNPNF